MLGGARAGRQEGGCSRELQIAGGMQEGGAEIRIIPSPLAGEGGADCVEKGRVGGPSQLSWSDGSSPLPPALSRKGRGRFLSSLPARSLLPLEQLQRAQPAVQHLCDGERLVGRNLARRHRGNRRVRRGEYVGGLLAPGEVERYGAPARTRRQPVDDEACRHDIAGERLVNDDAGRSDVFALRDGLAQHGCAVAGPRFLAGGGAGKTRARPP